MNIPLSARLKACCDFIHNGDRVADIGCDHGYLGIFLLKQGIAVSVIAADINQMPLQCAIRNSEKFGTREQMRFYLSDGAVKIPRDFDVCVCAGMGADTIVSILDNAPWLKSNRYRLVLQCQSKRPMLRQYLNQNGWQINREVALRDGRFLYTVMEAVYQPGKSALSPGEWHFSPALLENKNQITAAYYQDVVRRIRRALAGQKENADPVLLQALSQLEALAEAACWLKEDFLW